MEETLSLIESNRHLKQTTDQTFLEIVADNNNDKAHTVSSILTPNSLSSSSQPDINNSSEETLDVGTDEMTDADNRSHAVATPTIDNITPISNAAFSSDSDSINSLIQEYENEMNALTANTIVLKEVPTSVKWDSISLHFLTNYGSLLADHGGLDEVKRVAHLVFEHVSDAEHAKSYRGPLGTYDPTASKTMIYRDFIDLDMNLKFRALLYGVRPSDSDETLIQAMQVQPDKINRNPSGSTAWVLFEAAEKWSFLLDKVAIAVNGHLVTIGNARQTMEFAGLYTVYVGKFPKKFDRRVMARIAHKVTGIKPVWVQVIKYKQNNQPRGFGFVVINSEAARNIYLATPPFQVGDQLCSFLPPIAGQQQ